MTKVIALKKILVLLLTVLLVSFSVSFAEPQADVSDAETSVPSDANAASDVDGDPKAPDAAPDDGTDDGDPKPAPGYVRVSTYSQSGWLPLPEEGEYSYHLKQIASDGTEVENVIHLMPNGVYMEDSTCENHDCVKQGEVTLENKNDRILANMIICLPNQVWLELFTPEEVLELVKKDQGSAD